MSATTSSTREARRERRKMKHRAMKDARRKLLREFDEALANPPEIKLRWWYRPAVAVVTWWWACTRQKFKPDTITKLMRRAVVLP